MASTMLLGGGRSFATKLFCSSFYIPPSQSLLRRPLVFFPPRRTTLFSITSKSTMASGDAIDRDDDKQSVTESAKTVKDKTKSSSAAGKAEEVTENAKEKSKEKAGEAKEQAKDTAEAAKGKTKETAESMKENTKEGGKRVTETVQSVGEKAKQAVDGVWEAAKGTTRKMKETVVGKGDIDDDDDFNEIDDMEKKRLDKERKRAAEKMQDDR